MIKQIIILLILIIIASLLAVYSKILTIEQVNDYLNSFGIMFIDSVKFGGKMVINGIIFLLKTIIK